MGLPTHKELAVHSRTRTHTHIHTYTVGYSLTSINGTSLSNKCLPDGTNALKVIEDPSKYPLSLKFTRLRITINERIMLLSMFHS